MGKFKSFTLQSKGILHVLQTKCNISEAISVLELSQGVPHPPIKEFLAIWDTGASSSAISKRVVESLNLKPTGKGLCDTGAGTVPVDKYSVNILIPPGVGFSTLDVPCLNIKGDVLIGMDIISRGDFCITNKNGETIFTYQTPSYHEVDYTRELSDIEKKHIAFLKHGNNKCPCGSGKKWENCHG